MVHEKVETENNLVNEIHLSLRENVDSICVEDVIMVLSCF